MGFLIIIDIRLWSLHPKMWMSAWKRVPLCLNLLTVLYTDAAISTGRDPRVPGGLEGISGIYVQLVSANSIGVLKFVLLPEVPSVSWRVAEGSGDTKVVGAELNHYRSVVFWMLHWQAQETTLPLLPTMRDAVGGNCCSESVTVFSMLNASLLLMVVLLSMWRRSPRTIVRLLPTRMIVVVWLNSEGIRGIVQVPKPAVVIGDNWEWVVWGDRHSGEVF